jgi:hypothetical protein
MVVQGSECFMNRDEEELLQVNADQDDMETCPGSAQVARKQSHLGESSHYH